MRLSYVIIYVPEVEAAMDFYQKAFDLKISFLHESKEYGEMDTGATKLAFASEKMADMNKLSIVKTNLKNPAPGFELALSTPDVQAAYEKAIKCGALEVNKPEQKPWGQTVAYVRDLNGCLVELCTPMEML